MAQTIIIEKFIEKRDIDAALYLLGRMLSSGSRLLPEKREQLLALKKHLEHAHHITPLMRKAVILNYREVLG